MSFVADYKILDWLGPGNHGDWWLASPPERLGSHGDHVALKALWQDATDLDFDRMVRELRLLHEVSSPNLVKLIEAGETNGRLFYIRQHYPDGSLESFAPGDDRVFRALGSAASGAHDLHSLGVAHRDIKPSTILLDGDRGVLSELGLAQQIQPGMTTGIGPVGSVEYIAPEIALGERGSAQSDIWALGVVLHRVFTGQSIYGDDEVESVLDGYRRVTAGAWQLSARLADRPDISSVLHRCLARHREERYATADELAAALTNLSEAGSRRIEPGVRP